MNLTSQVNPNRVGATCLRIGTVLFIASGCLSTAFGASQTERHSSPTPDAGEPTGYIRTSSTPPGAKGIAVYTPAEPIDFNVAIMKATFKIKGPSAEGTAYGTVFILTVPLKHEGNTIQAYKALVTAAHVFEKISGEYATLIARNNLSGEWEREEVQIRIREAEKPLWIRNSHADVAVLPLRVVYNGLAKAEASTALTQMTITTDSLATDDMLKALQLHPGDELLCAGFPLGAEGNQLGFPILRGGKIATYPILPSSKFPTFGFDFHVFKGNSGGPVYLPGGVRNIGSTVMAGAPPVIIGLVTDEVRSKEAVSSLYENSEHYYSLDLARVVNATYIRETIDQVQW